MTDCTDIGNELTNLEGVANILKTMGYNPDPSYGIRPMLLSLGEWTEEIHDRIKAKLDACLDDKNPVENYLNKKKDEFDYLSSLEDHLLVYAENPGNSKTSDAE